MGQSIGTLFPLRWRLWLGKLLFRPLGPSTFRASWHRVIKGPCDPPAVEAMQYVASHTSIPLPRVYAVHTKQNSKSFIEMAWNSVFFDVIPISSYQVAVVTKDFKNDKKTWNNSFVSDGEYWITYAPGVRPGDHTAKLREMLYKDKLERLNNTDCIKRYLDTESQHKDVILVEANTSMTDGLSLAPEAANSSLIYLHWSMRYAQGWMWGSNWLCSGFLKVHKTRGYWERPKAWCTKEFLVLKADAWTLGIVYWNHGHTVVRQRAVEIDHCLSAGSEKIKDGCAIRYSMVLLILVTSLNAAILVCMGLTWRLHAQNKKEVSDGQWQKVQLVVLGDAISSFLQHPDEYTSEARFVEKQDCNGRASWSASPSATEMNARLARVTAPIRWYRAASLASWISILSLSVTFSFPFVFGTDQNSVSFATLIIGLVLLLIKSTNQLAKHDQSIENTFDVENGYW
ncbi:hypothetical protein FSARC_14504 [Fusarium sarcochroum]|uniref:Uncharacterized protein n=1 Tax=Fusarium sarcochroum TaxID=1208366 RepID=A0A8H4SSP8_9HYPO|nr:hypothetical protein FSARC_14504 [Fusarium sarcochroum]